MFSRTKQNNKSLSACYSAVFLQFYVICLHKHIAKRFTWTRAPLSMSSTQHLFLLHECITTPQAPGYWCQEILRNLPCSSTPQPACTGLFETVRVPIYVDQSKNLLKWHAGVQECSASMWNSNYPRYLIFWTVHGISWRRPFSICASLPWR